METIIQSLGFKAGDNLESFVKEKLDKISNQDNIIRANIMLFLGSDGNPGNHYCEIRLEIPGNDLFVKKSAGDFETAITQAVNTLQQLYSKQKEKMVDRQQGQI